MVTKIITNLNDFERLENHWIALHKKLNGTIFQSYYWNLQWWKIYKKENTELLIITTWNNDELTGILPLFHEKIKVGPIKFNRSRLLCVYQAYGEYEPLINPEYRNLVIKKFTEQLQQFLIDGTLDWVSFYGFPYNSNSMSEIIRFFRENRNIVLYKPKIVTRVIMSLPDSWDEYLEMLSNNEKTMLQRRTKSLKKNNVELEILKNYEIKSEDFQDFVKLHTASWENKGFPGFFKASEKFEKFLSTITTMNNYDIDRRLYFFKKNNKRFASVLAFFSYPVCYFHLSGMEQNHELSKYSPGKVLLSYVIKNAIEENYKTFDFQGGKETYKYQLGGKSDYYSKVDILKKGLTVPIILLFHYFIQLRQVLLTFIDYNNVSRSVRKFIANFKVKK